MTRDPFDRMKAGNPVPEGRAPSAPTSVADRIIGRRVARRAGWPGWAVAGATAVVVLAVGGGMYWWLGGGDGAVAGTTSTDPATATTVAPTTSQATPLGNQGVVYLFSDQASPGWAGGPYLIPVARQIPAGDPLAGSLAALLEGPTTDEAAPTPAFSTAIPADTELVGVTLRGRVAEVNLTSEFVAGGGSASMTGRLAQVVFTLTRLEAVDGVRFLIDGTPTTVFGGEGVMVSDPSTRADFEGSLPAVMIESPAWGDQAGNPLVVTGTANVFEAVVSLALLDGEGHIQDEFTATATCGTGCRGEWSITIPYTVDRAQWGSIVAWEASAMDGSQTNVREHRIWLTPSASAADPDLTVSVYFLAANASEGWPGGPYLIPAARMVDRQDAVRGSIELLLEGPHPDEAAADPALTSAVPDGSRLLGWRSDDAGVVTVDLSAEFGSGGGSFSMGARVAQVIATLTALDGVNGVRFEIEGVPTTVFGGEGLIVPDPATSADLAGSLPAVMIDTPAWGADGGNPLIARGTADVFEATVSVELLDGSGNLVFQGYTTATCGSGCRGAWEIEIPYEVGEPQYGTLRAFETSAEDGRPINVREHRVWLYNRYGGTGTTSGGEGCSGNRVTTVGLAAQPGLPGAVEAKRLAIWAAAMGCDWETLRSLLGPGFSYTFGEDVDAIGYWQELEAAGDEPMRYLAELLSRPFGTIVAGDFTYYVWPSAFNATGWQDVPPADVDALRPLYDDADFAGFAEFGGYIGYRISILQDGTWVAFVAGD